MKKSSLLILAVSFVAFSGSLTSIHAKQKPLLDRYCAKVCKDASCTSNCQTTCSAKCGAAPATTDKTYNKTYVPCVQACTKGLSVPAA